MNYMRQGYTRGEKKKLKIKTRGLGVSDDHDYAMTHVPWVLGVALNYGLGGVIVRLWDQNRVKGELQAGLVT